MKQQRLDPRSASLTAVMIAVTYVLTRLVQVPIGSQGFVHLGDAAVYFTAFAFGPWVGAVAGGLGTALVDATTGYAQWAVFTLLIHSTQGYAAGLVARRVPGLPGQILAVIVGGLILVLGYFGAGIILTGIGEALTGIIPNVIQATSGAVVGIPLYWLVLRAYPPLAHWGGTRAWTDR